MAKKGDAKPETKSEFLRKVLDKDPDLDYQQVNRRWAKAGHAGEISNALYYKARAELGIKTEWAWVKEEEPETRGSQEPGPETAGSAQRRSGRSRRVVLAPYPHVLQAASRTSGLSCCLNCRA